MPTPGQPQSAVPDHPTRQQLDELDALMRRMLALPVDPQEESSTGPVAAKSPDRSPSAEPVTPRSVAQPQSLCAAGVMEVDRGSVPTAGRQAAVESSVPILRSDTSEFAADSDERQVQPGLVSGKLSVTWWLQPFFWTNQVFDASVGWLGRPGRWLRGPQGRTLLGCIGLLLLGGALAWLVLDGIDWTW